MISEYHRLQLDHAWSHIEAADIDAEEKEQLRDFWLGMDSPEYAHEIELNLVWLYRLLGEMRVHGQLDGAAKKRRATARKAAQARHAKPKPPTEQHAWMRPYLERAHAELAAEGYARIGRRKLYHHARQLAALEGVELAQRRHITEHRAEQYLLQHGAQ